MHLVLQYRIYFPGELQILPIRQQILDKYGKDLTH